MDEHRLGSPALYLITTTVFEIKMYTFFICIIYSPFIYSVIARHRLKEDWQFDIIWTGYRDIRGVSQK